MERRLLLERKRREDEERRQQEAEMERILEENRRKVRWMRGWCVNERLAMARLGAGGAQVWTRSTQT